MEMVVVAKEEEREVKKQSEWRSKVVACKNIHSDLVVDLWITIVSCQC